MRGAAPHGLEQNRLRDSGVRAEHRPDLRNQRGHSSVVTAFQASSAGRCSSPAARTRVFRVSLRLGLFDPPERVPYSKIDAADDPEPWTQPETRALVREVTRKSIILLKNSAGLLPLDRKKVRCIAVVGPLANTVLLDWYSGTPPYAVSPRQGIPSSS